MMSQSSSGPSPKASLSETVTASAMILGYSSDDSESGFITPPEIATAQTDFAVFDLPSLLKDLENNDNILSESDPTEKVFEDYEEDVQFDNDGVLNEVLTEPSSNNNCSSSLHQDSLLHKIDSFIDEGVNTQNSCLLIEDGEHELFPRNKGMGGYSHEIDKQLCEQPHPEEKQQQTMQQLSPCHVENLLHQEGPSVQQTEEDKASVQQLHFSNHHKSPVQQLQSEEEDLQKLHLYEQHEVLVLQNLQNKERLSIEPFHLTIKDEVQHQQENSVQTIQQTDPEEEKNPYLNEHYKLLVEQLSEEKEQLTLEQTPTHFKNETPHQDKVNNHTIGQTHIEEEEVCSVFDKQKELQLHSDEQLELSIQQLHSGEHQELPGQHLHSDKQPKFSVRELNSDEQQELPVQHLHSDEQQELPAQKPHVEEKEKLTLQQTHLGNTKKITHSTHFYEKGKPLVQHTNLEENCEFSILHTHFEELSVSGPHSWDDQQQPLIEKLQEGQMPLHIPQNLSKDFELSLEKTMPDDKSHAPENKSNQHLFYNAKPHVTGERSCDDHQINKCINTIESPSTSVSDQALQAVASICHRSINTELSLPVNRYLPDFDHKKQSKDEETYQKLLTELNAERSQRMVNDQLVKILQTDVITLQQRNVQETTCTLRLESEIVNLKAELAHSQKVVEEKQTRVSELEESLNGTMTLVHRLEEQSAMLVNKGGIDYLLQAKIADGKAREAEGKLEILQAELLQSQAEVKNLLNRLSQMSSERQEMVSGSVHSQLIQIADSRAQQAELKVKELEQEVLKLRCGNKSRDLDVTGVFSYSPFTTQAKSHSDTPYGTLSGSWPFVSDSQGRQEEFTSITSNGFCSKISSTSSFSNPYSSYDTSNELKRHILEERSFNESAPSFKSPALPSDFIDATVPSLPPITDFVILQKHDNSTKESDTSDDWSSSEDEEEESSLRPSIHMNLRSKFEWLSSQQPESTTTPQIISLPLSSPHDEYKSHSRKRPPPIAPKPKAFQHKKIETIKEEGPVSFNEAAKLPTLQITPRLKGPFGRRPPSYHKHEVFNY